MPALFILVTIGCVLLWFLLAGIYKPVGRFFYRIFKDAKDEMTEEDSDTTDEPAQICSKEINE